MSDYKNGDTASWDSSQVRRSQRKERHEHGEGEHRAAQPGEDGRPVAVGEAQADHVEAEGPLLYEMDPVLVVLSGQDRLGEEDPPGGKEQKERAHGERFQIRRGCERF